MGGSRNVKSPANRWSRLESPGEDAEILSVVDSTDSVIGEKRLDEIHLQGFAHRAVHVLVFNPKGAIFLQERGKHKVENPGMWDSSVAGHVGRRERATTNAAFAKLTKRSG